MTIRSSALRSHPLPAKLFRSSVQLADGRPTGRLVRYVLLPQFIRYTEKITDTACWDIDCRYISSGWVMYASLLLVNS